MRLGEWADFFECYKKVHNFEKKYLYNLEEKENEKKGSLLEL